MIVQIVNESNNPMPYYSSEGAAGLDLYANLMCMDELKGKDFEITQGNDHEFITIQPGGRVLVPTGIYVAIPEGYHIDVRPRSGLALKQGLTVINTPGLIDSDYRGELGVVLINLSKENQNIYHGDRIAQIVLMKSEKVDWYQVDSLDDTIRGAGGFGSTGK
jgi:dUTP pyrophosphatase